MRVTIQQPPTSPRFPVQRDRTSVLARSGRIGAAATPSVRTPALTHQWLVDLTALSRCRALFARHGAQEPADARDSHLAMMDVPPAYDVFCRTHFAAVRRVHPELTWEDACPAYAIALSAHAVLCVALDDEREKQFESHWERIRGPSQLSWSQARPLIADGCSALGRMDPLAMQR